MFKNKKVLNLILVIITLSVLFPLLTQANMFVAPKTETPKYGLFMTECIKDGSCTICEIFAMVSRFIQWLWGISAAIALVFFVINGLGIIASAGNSEKLSKAKNGMINTIIALLIIFGSWTFINTILAVLLEQGPSGPVRILGNEWSNYPSDCPARLK